MHGLRENKLMPIKRMDAAWAAVAFTLALGLLVMLVLGVAGLTIRAGLLSAILLALLLPMAARATKRRLDLFEPIVLANIALGVMFVGRPLDDLITGEMLHLGYDIMPTFNEALLVAFVGIAFFQLGYFAPLGEAWARRLPKPPPLRTQPLALAAWSYLLFGGTLFTIFLVRQGGLGLLLVLLEGRQQSNNGLFLGATGYFYNGILMWGAAALVFFTLALVSKRRIYWLWFTAPALCFIALYGARGTRSNLLPLVLAVPTFWYLWKGRRPRARTLIVAAMIGVSLLGWLREVRTAGESRDFVDTLVASVISPVQQGLDIVGGPGAEMFDSMANELLVVPEKLPFQHGATVTDVLVRAVPRPLWPGKPLESNDTIVNTLWPEHYAKSRASAAFSIIGIFYVDSGYFTVALGMFLLGAVLATAWRWLKRHQFQPVAQMIYAMGLPFVVILMRGTIPGTLTRMLFLFVPLVLLMWVTRLRFGSPAPKRTIVPHSHHEAYRSQ